ncbi:hypothetical protein skT53_21160 [Effusibacillus dendaii]|uniref:HD domain-containing protein n=1 Tax=Effusibacillus dendaii TaxID=2743772 RepID=A0A7I8DH49_9BACL|nr:hypothetical protein [Effusibacillus dendaii]BCJ87131.1 hypothetical protein skT53_21160 [Effusibacillus dendaii]
MSKLLLLIGHFDSDCLQKLVNQPGTILLQESLYEPQTLDRVNEQLSSGGQAVVHASLRTPKQRSLFLQQAIEHKAATEVWFSNAHVNRHLQIPTYAEPIDRITVKQNVSIDEEAADFFRQQEAQLIEEPSSTMRQLQKDGRLLRWIPEYKRTIGLNQHTPHHSYQVFDHIVKAASFVGGTDLKMVWTLLLHDIGKGYPGIKQFIGMFVEPFGRFSKKDRVVIENGERIRDGLDSGDTYLVQGVQVPKEYIRTDLRGHFYDHENVGAQLALSILPRLGYSMEFALEVATLVQFHMSMPRDIDTISPALLKKWYARVGNYAAELMMVRMADNRGK